MRTLHHTRALVGPRGITACSLSMATILIAFSGYCGAVGLGGSDEPKTHTLFMGADISIEKNKEFVRVEDVSGGSFVVNVKDERVLIPMDKGTTNMRINASLKLTENSATVDNLKSDRAYTPGNDPFRKFASQQPGGAGGAQAGLALGKLNAALTTQSSAQMAASSGSALGPGAVAQARTSVASMTAAYDSAVAGSTSDYNDVGVYAGKLQSELDQKRFDAIDITFDLSSKIPLSSPYIVIVATYREANAKPGEVRNWIYAQTIDPVGRAANRVHILRGGFPPGFELQNYQLHLYNNGSELATNLSSKRVPLTREEAFQYLLMEYVSGHKNATLPAAPLMGKLPPDLPARLSTGQFAQTFYVKVSKDGQASEAFLDQDCSRKTEDPYIASLVKALRFKPALEKGKPVDGVAPLKLRELSI